MSYKVYVGSSININRRKLEHFLRLDKGVDGNEYLQRAWKKYGRENFEFVVLEKCSAENRLEREQHWIDRFKATKEQWGYNLIPTRRSQLYGAAISKHQKLGWAKHSKEERRKLNLHLSDPVLRKRALEKSNEVKKLEPWRANMEKAAWSKLRAKWQDPIQRQKILEAQQAGRERARLKRQNAQVVVNQ